MITCRVFKMIYWHTSGIRWYTSSWQNCWINFSKLRWYSRIYIVITTYKNILKTDYSLEYAIFNINFSLLIFQSGYSHIERTLFHAVFQRLNTSILFLQYFLDCHCHHLLNYRWVASCLHTSWTKWIKILFWAIRTTHVMHILLWSQQVCNHFCSALMFRKCYLGSCQVQRRLRNSL